MREHLVFMVRERGPKAPQVRTLLASPHLNPYVRRMNKKPDKKPDWWVSAGLVLPDDPSLVRRVQSELERAGAAVSFTHRERVYEDCEIEQADWLELRESYGVTIENKIDWKKDFDRSAACGTCGGGARLRPPLHAQLREVGKRDLVVVAAPQHYLIASTRLSSAVRDAGLTGVGVRPVAERRGVEDARFAWLEVTHEWPAMSTDAPCRVEYPCAECGRSGYMHVDPRERYDELVYDRPPQDAADFNVAWEYFGDWTLSARTGGCIRYVISQRAWQVLKRFNLGSRPVPTVHVEPLRFLAT